MGFTRLRRGAALKTLENGIIVLPDPAFTAIAACRPATGEYFVVEGKRWDRDFTATVQKYAQSGDLPAMQSNKIRMITMEAIAALYAEADMSFADDASDTDRTQSKLYQILEDAARARASDIKIYQRSTKTTVRVKIAGREFQMGRPLTVSEGDTILSILFDRRDDGGGETSNVVMSFQSFAISPSPRFKMPTGVIKLRGQKGYHETLSGTAQHMVLRLFYTDKAQEETATLKALGFDDDVFASLARSRRSLKGAIIIGGATGDGKSTTLSRCLAEQYREHDGRISIVTIEDPVEYKMASDGIIQIPIRSAGSPEERKTAYRKALMHFVRINPDVGCISEIRDHEAAKEVLQFVDTGHQVWTTIHVNSANGILFRLIDMGIPPSELSKPDAISLLMKQTLIPILCSHCSQLLSEANVQENLVGSFGSLDETSCQALGPDFARVRLRNRAGCPSCLSQEQGDTGQQAWAGYERQVAIAETIEPDENYLLKVRNSDMLGAKKYWLQPREEGGMGGLTIARKIDLLIRSGHVDPRDGIREGWDPQIDRSKQTVRPPSPPKPLKTENCPIPEDTRDDRTKMKFRSSPQENRSENVLSLRRETRQPAPLEVN